MWNGGDKKTYFVSRRSYLVMGRNTKYEIRKKDMSQTITPGRYRHYKGKDYQVLGCARHTETEEEFVVYRALYGEGGLWVRPKAMFLEPVIIDAATTPRFVLVEPA